MQWCGCVYGGAPENLRHRANGVDGPHQEISRTVLLAREAQGQVLSWVTRRAEEQMKGIGHGNARLIEEDTAAHERAMTVGQEALSRAVTWLEEMSAAESEGEAAEQDGGNEAQRGLDEASRSGKTSFASCDKRMIVVIQREDTQRKREEEQEEEGGGGEGRENLEGEVRRTSGKVSGEGSLWRKIGCEPRNKRESAMGATERRKKRDWLRNKEKSVLPRRR